MTGGYDGSYLDSTEVYDLSVGSWVVADAKLPRPMDGMRAISIHNRVLIFGKLTFFRDFKIIGLFNIFRGLYLR